MKKKVFSILTGVMALLILSAVPASALTKNEAYEIAKKYVPAGYTYVKTEKDGTDMEVGFVNGKYEFEVTVNRSGKVTEIEKDYTGKAGGKSFSITKKQAEAKVKKAFKNAVIIETEKERSKKDGCYYEIEFKTKTYRGEARVNAETGKIVEYEKEYY